MKRQMYCGDYNIGYARLAAAIIADGQKHSDQVFLNSDWCNLLVEFCKLANDIQRQRHSYNDPVEFCKLANDIQRHSYNYPVHLPKRKTYRSSD